MKHVRSNEITAGLDGALSPERKQRLREHIAQCERCRRLEGAIRQERDLVDRVSRGLNPSKVPSPANMSLPAAEMVRSFPVPRPWLPRKFFRIAVPVLLIVAASLSVVLLLSVPRRHSGVTYAELVEHAKGFLRKTAPGEAAGQPVIRSVSAGGRPARAYIVRDREVTFVWVEKSLEKDGNHEKIL
jgi:putative zinc finger protein